MAAQIFGLDIGRSFIKVVQIQKSGGRVTLIATGSLATPGNGISTDLKTDLKILSEGIKKSVVAAHIKGINCSVSIIESQAVTRLIELPNLTDKELSAAINFEADQYIPLPIKDVNIQYKVISRPQPDSKGKMQVLLIAAPKKSIQKYLDVIKMAGLNLKAIETESSALARALSAMKDQGSIIVSMGSTSTEFILVKEGNVLFSRSIATGGDAISKAIEAEFKLNTSQAEEYKMAYGILEDKLSGKIANIAKPILEIVVTEILKAVEYSKNKAQGNVVSRIVITGGGSYLPGLSEFLTQRTSLEVTLADPWSSYLKEGLIMKIPGQGSFYTIATGLALRT